MLGDSNKALPTNKGSQLVPGVMMFWQDSDRERWRGPILAVG